MPYFICIAVKGRISTGVEVQKYVLGEDGLITATSKGKIWIIRRWIYIREM